MRAGERTTGLRRRPPRHRAAQYRRPPEAAWSSSTSRRRPVEPARRPDRLAHRVAGARRRVARRPTACIASPRRYPCAEGPCQAVEVGARRRSAPRGRTRWIIAPQDASRRAPGAVPRAQRARGRRACAALLGDCAEDAVPPSPSGVAARAHSSRRSRSPTGPSRPSTHTIGKSPREKVYEKVRPYQPFRSFREAP
jgi:hypothetical protein